MADITKTFANATDNELSVILNRLKGEREALRLIRAFKIRITPNQKAPYPDYSVPESFSTESPVSSDSKSIKEMTDKELDSFIGRLNNENEIISIIEDIRVLNDPNKIEDYGNIEDKSYEGINLNVPISSLYHDQIKKSLAHFGIPGMHWGIRKGSSDHQESIDLKKKGLKNLSTSELKKLNDRLQQEKNYKSLNPNAIQKGKQAGVAILAGMATATTVYKFASSPIGKAAINTAKNYISTIGKAKWVL